jgi:hypothetical protein
MKSLQKYWISVFAMLISSASFAQIVPLMSLDSAAILTGERTKLHIMVEYRVDDGGHTIIWPEIGDTLANSIEIIAKSSIDTVTDPLKNDPYLFRQVLSLEITSFDTGFIAIQPLTFVIDGDSVPGNSLLIEVKDPVVDENADIKDIHDILEVELLWWEKLLPYLPYFAGAIILGLIIFFIWRKSKRNIKVIATESKKEEIKLPAHEKALMEFEKLRQETLWQKGKHKHYYSRLSDISREYLEDRFGIHAKEETSSELIREISRLPLDSVMKSRLESVLKLSDLVKFAKEKPLPHENEDALAVLVNFVQQTAEAFDADSTKSHSKNA